MSIYDKCRFESGQIVNNMIIVMHMWVL